MATVLIDPRLEAFVTEMTRKLQAHDHDRGEFGWREADLPQLVRWMHRYAGRIETQVLVNPNLCGQAGRPKPTDLAVVAEQAVNVANLAMMLWDVAQTLTPESET